MKRPAQRFFAGVILLAAISVHAYQSDAEDVEPDPSYTKTASDHAPPPTARANLNQRDAAVTRTDTKEKEEDTKRLRLVFLERLVDPVTWFTGFLLLVGIAQWFAMRRQVDNMSGQLTAAKDAADAAKSSADTAAKGLEEGRRANNLTLRAWVLVEGITIERFTRDLLEVGVTVRNYGKIPAIKVTAYRRFDTTGAAIVEIPDGDTMSGSRVIAAGQMHTYGFRMEQPEPFDEIRAMAVLLVLVARFRYTDALKTEGHTTWGAVFFRGEPRLKTDDRFDESPLYSFVS